MDGTLVDLRPATQSVDLPDLVQQLRREVLELRTMWPACDARTSN